MGALTLSLLVIKISGFILNEQLQEEKCTNSGTKIFSKKQYFLEIEFNKYGILIGKIYTKKNMNDLKVSKEKP